MRALIITFSLIAIGALIIVGGFVNAISGFGFDYAVPYNAPVRVVATLIGDTPGFAFALAAIGYALYDAARRSLLRWFIGLLAWPVAPLVAASLMYSGSLAYAVYWFLPLALLPLAALLYGIIVPAAVPASAGAPSLMPSPARYIIFMSVLVIVALAGGTFLLIPNLQPAAAQSGPPALQVNEPSANADCANGVYPPVTLVNTGSQTLQWTAKSQDPNVTTNPPEGSLAPGASAQITFSGKTTAPDVIVQFETGANGGVAKFSCQGTPGK